MGEEVELWLFARLVIGGESVVELRKFQVATSQADFVETRASRASKLLQLGGSNLRT